MLPREWRMVLGALCSSKTQITPHLSPPGEWNFCSLTVSSTPLQGHGRGFYISFNRTSDGVQLWALPPRRHRGIETGGGTGPEEPLRPRGPPAAAEGLPEAALHERGGGQQALELWLPEGHSRGGWLQRGVGGAQVPGRAVVLPQLHAAARVQGGEGRAAGVDVVRRRLPEVQQLVWGRIPGGDHQGVLSHQALREAQTV